MDNIRKRFKFSLPASFIEMQTNGSSLNNFTARDQYKSDLFAIEDLGIASPADLENYFSRIVSRDSLEYDIMSGYSGTAITPDSLIYTFDKLYERHRRKKEELVLYNAYKIFNGHLIVLSYTCAPVDSVKAKIILEDIFFHTSFNGNRIADPFLKVKALSETIRNDKYR